jgi:hypothetical protein
MMMQLRSPNPVRDAMIARARAVSALEQVPPDALNVYRRLLADPSLRSLTALQVADRLGRPVSSVVHGMAMLAQAARSRSGAPITASSILSAIGATSSTDEVLERFGSIASPNASSPRPSGGRAGGSYVLRPDVLEACLDCMPWARNSEMVRRMIYLPGVGNVARASSEASGMLTDTTGKFATDPAYQWKWTVVAGDNASRIAKQITGDDRRYPELIASNPSKATVGSSSSPYSTGYNFKTLSVGEQLLLPKAWNVYIASDGSGYTGGTPLPAGAAPVPYVPPPKTGSGAYSATLPAGSVLAVKLQLGAWGKKEGTLSSYPGPFDLNDAIDEPFLAAVRSFQVWSNEKKGTSLFTDGRLDKETHDAINAYSVTTTTTPPPGGLPKFGEPPKGGGGTTTPPLIATPGEKKKVGGSAGPLIAILALGAAKIAHLI